MTYLLSVHLGVYCIISVSVQPGTCSFSTTINIHANLRVSANTPDLNNLNQLPSPKQTSI